MVVQEITWAKSGTAHSDNDTLYLRNPNTNNKLGTNFLYVKKHTNNKKTEPVTDSMSHEKFSMWMPQVKSRNRAHI